MKLFGSLGKIAAGLLLLTAQASALTYKGFSLGANRPDGACKYTADWKKDFQTIKGWNKGFNAVRLYACSDCNTLGKAVPAAKATGIKILVGVWATDDAHFGREKAALLSAIKAHGTDWIAAISVGSEDLYRKDITPQKLAQQIYDVRGMVRQFNKNLRVGHTDTWTAWVDGANDSQQPLGLAQIEHNSAPRRKSYPLFSRQGVFLPGFPRTSLRGSFWIPGLGFEGGLQLLPSQKSHHFFTVTSKTVYNFVGSTCLPHTTTTITNMSPPVLEVRTFMPESSVDISKWWKSRNLRTLNLLLIVPMLSIFTQGTYLPTVRLPVQAIVGRQDEATAHVEP
ncbi:Glycoside hydrolase family 17 [Fusarium sp. LHS14.1]|nr:Glycoside hydrolase family 17 [Fusarium sp. LHS14.1]